MKLTKDQRFTAYCIMLAEYEDKDVGIGFCQMIQQLFTNQSLEGNAWRRNTDKFEELKAKEPKRHETDYGIWFKCNEQGRKKRIEILKQCIIETHP